MWFRLVSLLFLGACFWIGVEIYTQGTAGAFGGALARLGPGSASAPHAMSTLERVQRSASGARDRQLDRIERQLDGPSVGLSDRRSQRPED